MSPRNSLPDTSLRERWLLLARMAWLALAILSFGLYAAGIPYTYADYKSVCTGAACASPLTPEVLRGLHDLGFSAGFFAAYVLTLQTVAGLVFAVVAGVIFWHRPEDRIALFGAFALLLFGGAALNSDVSGAAAAAYPALWFLVHLLEYAGHVSYSIFFLTFPDGRFVPRWTRWLALVWAMLFVPDVFFPHTPLDLLDGPLFFCFIGSLVLAQVYRYVRVSAPVHRQQTKWVVFAMAVAGGGVVGTMTVGNYVPAIDQSGPLGQMISTALLEGFILLIPLSIGVAIVRSGLYEIDVIINRTLVYGSLTAVLVALYFGGIVTLQRVFVAVTGQKSTLAVVASTLLIAALFNPMRRRIQSFIDRRFYRSKYDARKTLEAFSAKLRDETDLEALNDDLLGVVRETMQPAHVSLWLRPELPPRASEGPE